MARKAKRAKGYKFNIKSLVRILLVFVIIYSLFRIFTWYKQTNKEEKIYSNLRTEIVQENDSIDFAKLKQKNSDIIGWIKIENTHVDYPIVQSEDNDYYLRRDIDKNYSRSGSIFMDYRNGEEFEDNNTILYGHNMKNSAMFGDLENIYDNKIKNAIITISAENEQKDYRVFSTYIAEADYQMDTKMDEYEYNQFLNEAIEKSHIDFDVEVTKENKILTLATCSYPKTKRIIVHAILEE